MGALSDNGLHIHSWFDEIIPILHSKFYGGECSAAPPLSQLRKFSKYRRWRGGM